MRKLTIVIIAVILLVCASVAGVFALIRPTDRIDIQASLSLADALGNQTASGFVKVTQPREFDFPPDHGPHPDYGIEWWYFTGNLAAQDNREFGYELTLFRIGLSPDSQQEASDWAASQVYMGHFALTDIAKGNFHQFERFSREALGLAGATSDAEGFAVWLEDWSITGEGAAEPVVSLRASEDGIAIDLSLASAKPIVLQGRSGLSQKSAEEGNASYYYSATRMTTDGVITLAGNEFGVQGTSWMDREWSTTALSPDQVGWDWFALQLSDNRDLMYYQLRTRDGGVDPFSSGILVAPDGTSLVLAVSDVQLEVLDIWTSPQGSEYPSRWLLKVPSADLELEVTPVLDDQELNVSVTYWEGAVRVSGTSYGEPVQGQGYVELTGYADDPGGRS